MSSVVAIDLGSSCHRVVVSEKNALGNSEYSPTTLCTDSGARSFRYSHCANSIVDACFHTETLVVASVIIVLLLLDLELRVICRIPCFIAALFPFPRIWSLNFRLIS